MPKNTPIKPKKKPQVKRGGNAAVKSANRTSKMEAEAQKKLKEVNAAKKKKRTYKKGGKVGKKSC